MIPRANTATEIDTLPGRETAFRITNAAIVMNALADLYSNRELACIREYSTNARDANVDAGNRDKPIMVTLPTATHLFFSVQDFGPGMTVDELEEIYTGFGESTKRDNAEANGMLGFGCKSAIAYTNSFTVESVKNGYKTVGAIVRKANGGIVLKTIMEHVPTDEHSGIKVTVPVHNWQEFRRKAEDFYRFWYPGTVLVDGAEPEWAAGEKIGPGLYISRDGVSRVVMSNVAYRIANPSALFSNGMKEVPFVAYVDNGAVEFTPSREDLKYTDYTKAALHKVIDDFAKSAIAQAKKEISSAKTHAEAYTMWVKWRETIGAANVEGLSFKGDKFDNEIKFSNTVMRYNGQIGRYNTQGIRQWTVDASRSALFITDFPSTLASAHKSRVKKWAADKNLNVNFYFFVSESFSNPWIDPARVVSWEQVKKDTPVVRNVGGGVGSGRLAGSFDLLTRTGHEYEKDVPSTKPLYYIMARTLNDRGTHSIVTIMAEFKIDGPLVIMPQNRLAKFKRHYPHAVDFIAHVTTLVNFDGPSFISEKGKKFLDLGDYDSRKLQQMNAKKIDDPDLAEFIELAKMDRSEVLKDYNAQFRLAQVIGQHYKFKRYDSNRSLSPLDRYPLVQNGGYRLTENMEHYYIYMNALYKARKDGQNV